ncbi:MAG: DNA repair protein RecO [Pseudomonadota bacterium]
MDWRDEGLLLSVRRHGENGAVIEALTAEHGRHAGLVRGGGGVKLGAILQPGSQLALQWHARLEDQLGTYKVEPIRSRAAPIMADRARLSCLNALAALVLASVPEREPDAELYGATVAMADKLAGEDPFWPAAYARWELALLAGLGFGLDLTRCAASGVRSDLIYVSPRTGRAVSRSSGAAWADRLLPLPGFLVGKGMPTMGAVREALRLTGHFFETQAMPALGRDTLPPARERLIGVLETVTLPKHEEQMDERRADEAEYHRSMGETKVIILPGNGSAA